MALFGLAACGGTTAGEPVALATPPDVAPFQVQDVVSVDLKKQFKKTPQEINDYWTDERTQHASPLAPPRPGPTNSSPPPRTTAPTTTAPKTTSAPRSSTPPATTAPRTSTAPPTTSAAPPPTTSAPPPPPPPPPPAPPMPPQDPGTLMVIDPTRGTPNPDTVLDRSSAGEVFGKPGLTASTAGRLYFTMNGTDRVCSATVVAAASRNIVASAGHCVWDARNGTGWGSAFLFIPGDAGNGAESPYGRWTASYLHTTNAFMQNATETDAGTFGDGWAYDSAFLTMSPNAKGQLIQDVTGGQGIAFGSMAITSLIVIGYPTAAPFDGRSERYCSSPDWWSGWFGDLTIACTMTPGCSGGGWLTAFDPVSGAGYLVGVVSLVGPDPNGTPVNTSSHLGDNAYSAYYMAVTGA